MRMISVGLLLLAVGAVHAGQYNKVLNLGDAAPAWKELPGVDGKRHSLADLKDKPVVVVVFTCNSCPVAVDYEERIIGFTKKYADRGVAVVAINVNVIPEDRLDQMQVRAKERGFNFPYLFDESQQIARDYGANYTPEFFVLNQDRKVVYMGAMDEVGGKGSFLEPAVEAALKGGKPEKGETLGRGCRIRYLRKK